MLTTDLYFNAIHVDFLRHKLGRLSLRIIKEKKIRSGNMYVKKRKYCEVCKSNEHSY